MNESQLTGEDRALMWSWDQYPAHHLDQYLVQGFEDPRINCQSILTRALLVDTLWPGEFNALINDELRFGAVLTWLIQQRNRQVTAQDIHNALLQQDPHIPAFVAETYAWLMSEACPIPDYMTPALFERDPDQPQPCLGPRALDSFAPLWGMALAGRKHRRITVLEPACGSANDYRHIDACGLAPFLDYAGFDISYKNIDNARRHFPHVPFSVGSIYEAQPAGAADYVFVHDLFEHLSPQGLRLALEQVMRLTVKQAWFHFFNLAHRQDHAFRQVGTYYWNTLSLERIKETLSDHASDIEVISIPALLQDKFAWSQYHNQEAVTLLVTK